MAKPIALQMYSLREAAAADLIGTVKRVAEIGYVGVEPDDLQGMQPAEFTRVITDLGMKVSSIFPPALPKKKNLSEFVEQQQAFGNTIVVTDPSPSKYDTVEAVAKVAAAFERAAQLLKPHGIKLATHNHWWEFTQKVGPRYKPGRYAYDVFMELAPSVLSELDVYWAAYGWADPVEVVSRHKSRIPLIHAKDGTLEEGWWHTAIGSGALDMPAIINAADPTVLEWVIVELDNCKTSMMEAVEESYRYLTSNGLAYGRK